ncbi:MAG: efflux RND transporter periplasmic adaptor subunit [Rhodospirillales bacterium]
MRSTTRPRLSNAVTAAILAAGLLTAGAPAGPAVAQSGGATPVGVDTVIEEAMAQTMPVIGRLVAQRTGVVAARINGPIGQFDVRVGDRVEAGDIIASLVDDALRATRDLWRAAQIEAESGVATKRAELQLRRQELERLEKLSDSSAFNPSRVADKRQEIAIVESEIGELRAAVAEAEANLRLAEINLYNAEVRAPYAGVITARHTEVGAYVQVGAPVVTLIDDRSMEIEADVPTDRVAGLAPGSFVTFRFTGGPSQQAIVRATIPDENPLTRTRSVRFAAGLPSELNLAANQSVTLQVPVGVPRDIVSVHKDAILERGGQRIVFRVVDGAAELTPVRIGEAVGQRFEVLSGLQPGDLVVVRGNERLQPGQPVDPSTQPSAVDAGASGSDG